MRPRAVPPAVALLGLLLLALSTLPGCRSPYWRSRGYDLLDTFPGSVGFGWGLAVSAQATPFFDLGLGLSPVVSERYGYEDRRVLGEWHEFDAAFPWSLFVTSISPVPPHDPDEAGFLPDGIPLHYRWQVDRDSPLGEGHHRSSFEPQPRQWGRVPPYGRETGGGFVWPAPRRELVWRDVAGDRVDPRPLKAVSAPAIATLWDADRDGPAASRAWDLFSIDVHVIFFGFRVGVRPVEAVDLLLGFVWLDPLFDDVPAPTHTLPPLEDLPALAPPEESGAADDDPAAPEAESAGEAEAADAAADSDSDSDTGAD